MTMTTEKFNPDNWIDKWLRKDQQPEEFEAAVRYLTDNPQPIQVTCNKDGNIEATVYQMDIVISWACSGSPTIFMNTYAIKFCPQPPPPPKPKKLNWIDAEADSEVAEQTAFNTPNGYVLYYMASDMQMAQTVVWKVIQELRGDWEPDILNTRQKKHCIALDKYPDNNYLVFRPTYTIAYLTGPIWQCLPSKEACHELIERIDRHTLLLGLYGINEKEVDDE